MALFSVFSILLLRFGGVLSLSLSMSELPITDANENTLNHNDIFMDPENFFGSRVSSFRRGFLPFAFRKHSEDPQLIPSEILKKSLNLIERRKPSLILSKKIGTFVDSAEVKALPPAKDEPTSIPFSDTKANQSSAIILKSEILPSPAAAPVMTSAKMHVPEMKTTDAKTHSKRLPRRVTISKSALVAKKCCASDHYFNGDDCDAKTEPVSFNPHINIDFAPSVVFRDISWRTMLPECPEGYKHKRIDISENNVVLKVNETDILLQWTERESTKTSTQYCIDQQESGNYSAIACELDVEEVCKSSTCVRKCCGLGELKSDTTCKEDERPLNLTFHSLSGDPTSAPEDLRLVSLGLDCPHHSTIKFSEFPGYPYLLPTGRLFVKEAGQILDSSHFCVDYYIELEQNIVEYCFSPRSTIQKWKSTLAPICLIISIVFLLLLVLFHLLTKELRNNAQGLCFLSYTVSLMLAFTGFFTNFTYAKQLSYSHCVFNALFSHFTLLAAFFWLSVMCFDIWRMIRASVKGIRLTGMLENDKQKFLLYSAYAFGCPLVISLVTLLMQSLPPESTHGLTIPGFGEESCWFPDETAQFLYFYLFVGLLNGLSLLLLGHVIFLLCEADQGFSCFFRGRPSSRAFNRKHLALFRQRLSIFAVMAICWFTEVLSLKIPPADAWVVTDLLNTLQGLIVFIIFMVSKKKRQVVKKALLKRFECLNRILPSSTPGSENVTPLTSKTSSSSGKSLDLEEAGVPPKVKNSSPEGEAKREQKEEQDLKEAQEERRDGELESRENEQEVNERNGPDPMGYDNKALEVDDESKPELKEADSNV